RARLQIREVGAGVGLGEPLAPHLLGAQDLGEEALLLGGRAVLHQGRAEHAHAAAVHDLRRLGPRHFLIEDDDLDDRRAAAAELTGPVDADVAASYIFFCQARSLRTSSWSAREAAK